MTKRYELIISLPDEINAEMARTLANEANWPWPFPEGAAIRAREVRPGKLLFDDIVRWAETHQQENPGHGINCACADDIIRQVRLATGIAGADALIENRTETATRAQQRVDWVLGTALRRH